jgi:phospholipase C
VTAPLGTPGEYVTAPAVPDPTVTGSPAIAGPIGLGFRVPMLIISPFSRGGLVSSDLFDHTSVLRFLETRFGAEVPNLSTWRRATVGDLTSAFDFRKTDQSIPNLPSTVPAVQQAIQQCAANLAGTTPYTVPNTQTLPTGIRNRHSSQWSVLVKRLAPHSFELRMIPGLSAIRKLR